MSCARTGTTARAADELNLTQSAISRSIRSLEEKLGVQVFDRVRKRLILSDAGRVLAKDAEEILGQIDVSARNVMAFSGSSNVLRIGVLPTFASSWLIPKLPAFRQIAPHVSLDLSSALSPINFETEPFDCAIQRASLSGPGTEVVKLLEERLVVVGAPKFRAVIDRPPIEITKLDLIQQSTRPTLWLEWLREAEIDQTDLLRGPRFEHFGMVIAAAKSGMGAALLPEILVQNELASGELIQLSDRAYAELSPYALIYPSEHRENPTLLSFQEWLRAELA